MTDIVERLRKAEVAGVLIPCDDLKEAADEIERLRAPVGKSVAEAPQDDGEHAFQIKFNARAFWCGESKRWVLSRPLEMECLPSSARYLGPATALTPPDGGGK